MVHSHQAKSFFTPCTNELHCWHGFRKKSWMWKATYRVSIWHCSQSRSRWGTRGLCKAFDKVNHNKLQLKLAQQGISHQLISWVDSFLSGRSQKVVIDGEELSEAPVTSGVPQWSVLGPAIFLFYINDLLDNLQSTVRLFADDTIDYNTAKNNPSLQDDLMKLEMWEDAWNMEFHPLKCQQITFSCKRQSADQSLYIHNWH